MKKMRKFIACASFKTHKIGIYQSDKFKLNKIAARWPAKAVAQLFTFSKKGSDRIVPR